MWSGLSICRSVAMAFDRLLGFLLVGWLPASSLAWWDGGFVCFLGWLVSCSVGWLMSFVFS